MIIIQIPGVAHIVALSEKDARIWKGCREYGSITASPLHYSPLFHRQTKAIEVTAFLASNVTS